MKKPLLYRFLKIGQVPQTFLPSIHKENIVLLEEGINGKVTFQNFTAPGKRYGWKRIWYCGSIVLTQEHFWTFKYSHPLIKMAWSDLRIRRLNCFLEDQTILCIEFDAVAFNDNWSGKIDIRLHTPMAQSFLDSIEHHIATSQ